MKQEIEGLAGYLFLIFGVGYFAGRYMQHRRGKKGLIAADTDGEIEDRAIKIIEIAGRAALNAGSEATQQFHREHPERCYVDDGRLFSPEYNQIYDAAEQTAYSEILGIALSCADSRLTAAVRRSDCGARSAAMQAGQRRYEEIKARLDAEAPRRAADLDEYNPALAEARAGSNSEFASVHGAATDNSEPIKSVTPAEFARRQR